MKTIPWQLRGCAVWQIAGQLQKGQFVTRALKESAEQLCMDLSESISSQGSEGGTTRLSSQDGQLEGRSGQEAAHVSHSAEQGRCGEKPMKDTSGQRCGGSLESADLQRSLESRLRANLGANGSMEYSLTWKQWAIGSREPICALRASGHRTSDKDYTGWPTPTVGDSRNAMNQGATRKNPDSKHHSGITLVDAVNLAGWGTPNCMDHLPSGNLEERKKKGGCSNLKDQVSGIPLTSSPATTENRGALNGGFSRWLMGYPVEWCQIAISTWRMRKQQGKRGR